MKNNSIIGLVIVCSLIASIFGAALTTKLLNKGNNVDKQITGNEILSIQKELQKIKLEKNNTTNQNNNINNNNSNEIGNLENNIVNIAKNASPQIVSIIIKKDLAIYKSDPWGFFKQKVGSIKQKTGGGTGFFATKDGMILTNKHVVSDKKAEYTVITNSGEEFIAKVIATDPYSDLAIIKIDSKSNSGKTINIQPLKFIKNNDEIKLGQFAIAIGNKLGELDNSVSFGLVSGKNRVLRKNNINISNLIQTDADIHPGNSGGPLLNIKGEVIGINTFMLNQDKNIGFAISLNKKDIKYILNSIKKYGKIIRPFLGINYISNSEMIKEKFKLRSSKGVYILDRTGAITKGSNADKAGIEIGDIITQIDKIDLNSKNNLNSIINSKISGDTIKLKIIKPSGEIKRLKITL